MVASQATDGSSILPTRTGMENQSKQIAEYYDKTLPFYKIFWHRDDESYALHYGFWDGLKRKMILKRMTNKTRPKQKKRRWN